MVNIKQELLRQIKTYKRCISIKEKHLHRQQAALRRLVQCAKVSPLLASEIVGRESGHGGMHHWVSREKLECVASIGGKRCHTSSLPYSKYCLQREFFFIIGNDGILVLLGIYTTVNYLCIGNSN